MLFVRRVVGHIGLLRIPNTPRTLLSMQTPLILATGKTFESTRAIRERLGMDNDDRCVSIHVNGLVIHDHNGDVISETCLSTPVALRVMRKCWEKGYPTILYSGTRILSREESDLTRVMPNYHVCCLRKRVWPAASPGQEKCVLAYCIGAVDRPMWQEWAHTCGREESNLSPRSCQSTTYAA